jgi:hypothetical protein
MFMSVERKENSFVEVVPNTKNECQSLTSPSFFPSACEKKYSTSAGLKLRGEGDLIGKLVEVLLVEKRAIWTIELLTVFQTINVWKMRNGRFGSSLKWNRMWEEDLGKTEKIDNNLTMSETCQLTSFCLLPSTFSSPIIVLSSSKELLNHFPSTIHIEFPSNPIHTFPPLPSLWTLIKIDFLYVLLTWL